MLLPGHMALGYLTSEVLLAVAPINFDSTERTIITSVTILSSIIPDSDLGYFFFKRKSVRLSPTESHRALISHAPIIWAFSGSMLYIFGTTDIIQYAGIALWIGAWSHFIGDSIEYGIMWLWPFSKKKYALRTIPDENPDASSTTRYYWTYFSQIYTKNATFYIELIVICIAGLMAYFS